MDQDAEFLDCVHRIALALECINRNLAQIKDAVKQAVESQAAEI